MAEASLSFSRILAMLVRSRSIVDSSSPHRTARTTPCDFFSSSNKSRWLSVLNEDVTSLSSSSLGHKLLMHIVGVLTQLKQELSRHKSVGFVISPAAISPSPLMRKLHASMTFAAKVMLEKRWARPQRAAPLVPLALETFPLV